MAVRDALDRYKLDGRELDSRGARSAFRGAAHLAQEHPEWLGAGGRAGLPYRRAAELRAGRWVGLPNSASPEDAMGRPRMLCPLPQFAKAAVQIREWVLTWAGLASESSALRRWAGERPA